MKQVLILAEGQTEEVFINMVLSSHFEPLDIHLQPVIIETSRSPTGRKHKGGVSSYSSIKKDVQRLLGNTHAHLVTTMPDYYGLPEGFPGKTPSNRVGTPSKK